MPLSAREQKLHAKSSRILFELAASFKNTALDQPDLVIFVLKRDGIVRLQGNTGGCTKQTVWFFV